MDRSPADFVRTMLRVGREERTGVVGVKAESLVTKIYFRGGTPVFAAGGAVADSLGRLLLDEGRISEDDFKRALDRMIDVAPDDQEMRLGELLVVLGSLSLDEVTAGLTLQVRRKIERCVGLPKMKLSFDQLPKLPDTAGKFPCEIEPCVLSGARRYFDTRRAAHYLGGLSDAYLSLGARSDEVAHRFGATEDDAAVLASLDGTRSTKEIVEAHLANDVNPYPMLTALVLAASVSASKKPLTARTSSPGGRSAARGEEPSDSPPNSQPGGPRSVRVHGKKSRLNREELRERASRPRQDGTPSSPGFRSTSSGVRGPSSSPAGSTSVRSRSSSSQLGRSSHPGLDPPTSEPPARISGVGLNAVSEIPGPASQRRPASVPGAGQQLSRLQAEQAFQRGVRYLRAEQFRRAADALTDASAALPDALEYQLYAKWASYRACEVPGELSYLRSELEPIAKLLAKQDRAHALPPYVLAHLALTAEDEAKALKLFKMAARRDPRNKDAVRHVRLLSTRANKA